MNQRIQELAAQAMVTIPAAEGPLSHTYFDKEKFGELIVRECIDKIRHATENTEQYDLAYNAMLTAIIADIQESFEIQETKREKFDRAIKKAFERGVDLSGKETP